MNVEGYVRSHFYPVHLAFLDRHGLGADLSALDRVLDQEAHNLMIGQPTFPPMTGWQFQQHLHVLMQREAPAGMAGLWGDLKKKVKKTLKKVEDKVKSVGKKIDDKLIRPQVKAFANVATLGISGKFDKAAAYAKQEAHWKGIYQASVKAGAPNQRAYTQWKRYEALHKKNVKSAQKHVQTVASVAAVVVPVAGAAMSTGGALTSAGLKAGAKQLVVGQVKSEVTGKVVEAGVKQALKGKVADLKKQQKKAKAAQASQAKAQTDLQTAQATPVTTEAAPAPGLPIVPIGLLLTALLG